jgi:hypothetical protein
MVGFRLRGGFVRRTLSAVALLLLAAGLASGCAGESSGSDEDLCPESCARGRKCPGIVPSNQSCDDECLGQDALAVQSGCHEVYLKSVACLAKLEDICTGLKDCKEEILAAQMCELNYCQTHQQEDVCKYIPVG